MYMKMAAVAIVIKPSYGPNFAERYTKATTMSMSMGTARKQIDSRMLEMLWPHEMAIMMSEELLESWKSEDRLRTWEYAAVLMAPNE
jgi:hypothetical protein